MKAESKIYIKYFFIYASSLAVVLTVWDFLEKGELDYWRTLFVSLFFGAGMGWRERKNHLKYGK